MYIILTTLISLVIYFLLMDNEEEEVLVVSGEVKAYTNDTQYIRYIQRECGTPQPSDYRDNPRHFPQDFIEF